ncbi:MAG: hypothetical protein M5T61_08780 [Acidimicrobiia bacterium]|nr:hypothetical protein [Acidimicrobiia bacterium]
MSGTTIAVTGASGLLGQRLLPLLEAMPQVERIVGFDVREPTRRTRKLEFHCADIAGAEIEHLIGGPTWSCTSLPSRDASPTRR